MGVLLNIENLSVSFKINGKFYPAVDNVSFQLQPSEICAVVGESGCGKTALALSILQLHDPKHTKMDGKIDFRNQNLLELSEKERNKIRGKEISMIFQDPLTALNPLMTIGKQIEESLFYHTKDDPQQRKEKAISLLNDVGIYQPKSTYERFPHELSGGMRQRVMIAIALSCNPSLIIADEPTTALDVTLQAQVLSLMKDLQQKRNTTVMLITHDFGVVAEMADRVIVMYAGQIVEMAPVYELFKNPQHPYTRSLLASIPAIDTNQEALSTIKGQVPPLNKINRNGCRFAPRIPELDEKYHEPIPTYHEVSEGHMVLCTCYRNFELKAEGL